jgi:hypothetical protein
LKIPDKESPVKQFKLNLSPRAGWIILAGLMLTLLMVLTIQCDNKEQSEANNELDRKVQSIQNDYSNAPKCKMCGKAASGKTVCTIPVSVNETAKTCCAHCGILILKRMGSHKNGSAICYTTGQRIELKKAFFVENSDVKICCSPSVLAFYSREEAEKFVETHHGEIKRFRDF